MLHASAHSSGMMRNQSQQNESRIPNVYWRSLSLDTLRRESRATGLPPVDSSHAGQAPHARYVRQDSALWGDLHDGMLTTGRLKQALGMHEPKAAGVIGIHPGSRGSSHLLSAYFHLLATSAGGSSNLATSGSSSNPGSMQDAIARSEAARQAFNAQLAAAPEAEAGQAASMTALRIACEHAALAGDVSVRLLWGKVQEGAALHSLLQLFPAAQLEEVGLFELQPEQLPPAWGLDPATLPRLGASPDGLLVHQVSLAAEDLRAAAAALRDSSQAAGSSEQGQAAAHAAQQAVLQQLLRRALDAVPCSGTRPRTGVPLESSSDEEQEEAADGSGSNDEAAAGNAGSSAADELSERLAGVSLADGAVSAAAAAAAAAAAMPVSVEEAGSLAFPPVDAALLALLEGCSCSSTAGAGASSSGRHTAAGSTGAAQQPQQQQAGGMQQLCVREVVEVKNHAPFAFRAKRKGKKGRVVVSYSFRPRGPSGRVHAQWVPQLQMHMLASGCMSALLVSRCAELGVRVFRLWRDDAYLETMLQLLAVLQTQAVAPGVAPSAQLFASLPGYRPFLQRTVTLARGAACVAAAGPELVAGVPLAPDGRNAAKFWPHQA